MLDYFQLIKRHWQKFSNILSKQIALKISLWSCSPIHLNLGGWFVVSRQQIIQQSLILIKQFQFLTLISRLRNILFHLVLICCWDVKKPRSWKITRLWCGNGGSSSMIIFVFLLLGKCWWGMMEKVKHQNKNLVLMCVWAHAQPKIRWRKDIIYCGTFKLLPGDVSDSLDISWPFLHFSTILNGFLRSHQLWLVMRKYVQTMNSHMTDQTLLFQWD